MTKTSMRRIFLCGLFATLPLSSCTCEDQNVEPWEFTEFEEAPPVEEPIQDEQMMEEEEEPPPMTIIPPDIEWVPEVIEEVPREQALNDRTSIDVGADGRIWVGYHRCDDDFCSDPRLATASREPDADGWLIDPITPQSGTFGLVMFEDQPWVAYLDTRNDQFRVGTLEPGADEWTLQPLDVEFTGAFDGLDLTHDDTRLYVTFAGEQSNRVDLFVRDMVDPDAQWVRLRSLDTQPGASAALERGLQADGRGNLYLVHRDGRFGPYGVARFRLGDNIWDRLTYLTDSDVVVSSMLVRDAGDVCMSSEFGSRVLLTCGRMNDLARDYERLEEIQQGYSSMIEGTDGSLMIAFNSAGNDSLKVARLYPDGVWDVRTVFEGSSFGVSTGLDLENKLLISYYTCRRNRCTLELLRQPY